MIRQLQKRPAAIPPAASGGTKPPTDAELCQVSTPESSEFNSKDTQKLVENWVYNQSASSTFFSCIALLLTVIRNCYISLHCFAIL